jgi:hypothetical protein
MARNVGDRYMREKCGARLREGVPVSSQHAAFRDLLRSADETSPERRRACATQVKGRDRWQPVMPKLNSSKD